MKHIIKKMDGLWMEMGVAFAILLVIPYAILGENAVVSYHDQLDGELITYVLNAKYLFSGVKEYSELMLGIPKNGMVSPAPLYVLFFKAFPPYAAFLVCMMVNKLVQFLFSYLLTMRLTRRKWLAFFTGIWFTCLPFYTVYGLCIPGQPMLLYAMCLLGDAREKNGLSKRKTYVVAAALITFYGLASSLALCGFACLVTMAVVAGFCLVKKKRKRGMEVLGTMILLAGVYAFCNLSLIGQLLGISKTDFITHKSEVKFTAVSFWDCFWAIFLQGEDYCGAQSVYVLPVILAVLVLGGIYVYWMQKKGRNDAGHVTALRKWKWVVILFLALMLIVTWRAFYSSEMMVALRNGSTGVIHDFNFGRFTWLMPSLWCLCFAASCDFVMTALENLKNKGRVIRAIACAVFVSWIMVPALAGVYSGDLKPNLVKILRGGDYYMMTWKQFYAEDLFEEVRKVIGRPQEKYHVVSLGIYPAAAAYNGFLCLDAYSNNYDLEYKHRFRRVIAPQLEKSEYLRNWFDDWGNRCYMVLAQFGNYFTFEKRWGSYTDDYDFDLGALKDLGGEYVISAVYLNHWEGSGLRLLNEEPIQTNDSWYRLWVYEVE